MSTRETVKDLERSWSRESLGRGLLDLDNPHCCLHSVSWVHTRSDTATKMFLILKQDPPTQSSCNSPVSGDDFRLHLAVWMHLEPHPHLPLLLCIQIEMPCFVFVELNWLLSLPVFILCIPRAGSLTHTCKVNCAKTQQVAPWRSLFHFSPLHFVPSHQSLTPLLFSFFFLPIPSIQ